MSNSDLETIIREIEQMLVVYGWAEWSAAAARGEW